MVRIVKPDQRNPQPLDVPGATVQVSDAIVGKENNLAAGFTEYLKPSKLEWTFDYDEVFFMLDGTLEIHVDGRDPIEFEVGDLGFIERGTRSTIVVRDHAYLLHFTQPAWQDPAVGQRSTTTTPEQESG